MRPDGIVPREIDEGPAAIRETVISATAGCRDIAAALRTRVRRIWVIGNGTSYHSSLFAAALVRRMRKGDQAVAIAVTAGEFRAAPPILGDGDIVVGVSASGEFRDVVAVFEELRGRVPTVAVVHTAASTLTQLADHVVLTCGGPSAVPVMTKTFSSTATGTALTVSALLSDEALEEVSRGVTAAAGHAEAAIERMKLEHDAVVETLVGARQLFVVGGGNAYPAALEAALKLKEMALVQAEAAETWEMTSGAASLVGPGTVVLAITPVGPARAATLELVEHCRSWGATAIHITGDAGGEFGDKGATEAFSVLSAVPPVALAAFGLARHLGHDPDHPFWTERYTAQGLNHVVGTSGHPTAIAKGNSANQG
jgi:glucosamine--fructose-6-phosphate aminotransferase (isomerizing)